MDKTADKNPQIMFISDIKSDIAINSCISVFIDILFGVYYLYN